MIRKLLVTVLPFLLPFAGYAVYVVLSRRAAARGRRWEDAPWYWLVSAGLACVIISLGALALTSGAPPGSTYQPARLEDGKIVPGGFK